jgi:hypothetical protein
MAALSRCRRTSAKISPAPITSDTRLNTAAAL